MSLRLLIMLVLFSSYVLCQSSYYVISDSGYERSQAKRLRDDWRDMAKLLGREPKQIFIYYADIQAYLDWCDSISFDKWKIFIDSSSAYFRRTRKGLFGWSHNSVVNDSLPTLRGFVEWYKKQPYEGWQEGDIWRVK